MKLRKIRKNRSKIRNLEVKRRPADTRPAELQIILFILFIEELPIHCLCKVDQKRGGAFFCSALTFAFELILGMVLISLDLVTYNWVRTCNSEIIVIVAIILNQKDLCSITCAQCVLSYHLCKYHDW